MSGIVRERPPARPPCLQPDVECLGTVLAAHPTVNEPTARGRCAILHDVRITGIRLDRWSCRSTRRSRPPGIRSRGARSRRRSSGSRPTRASSASVPATRWAGSTSSSTCSSAGPAAIAHHVRVLETIDFHAGRYWPLEAALWDIAGQVAGVPVATLFGGATTGSRRMPRAGRSFSPAARAESALRLRDEGFRRAQDPVEPRRLEEGLACVAATRARGRRHRWRSWST